MPWIAVAGLAAGALLLVAGLVWLLAGLAALTEADDLMDLYDGLDD